MEGDIRETNERARFFQTVHAWPLTSNLNYEGWLKNFKGSEKDTFIASLILDFFVYYPTQMIRQMLSTSVGQTGYIIKKNISTWTHAHFKNQCFYSTIPGETPHLSDSGNYFTRLLKDLGVPEERIVDYRDLPSYIGPVYNNPVIFVDDFVGTGNQIEKAWNKNKCNNGNTLSEICAGTNQLFIYAPLIVNYQGMKKIHDKCNGLHLSAAHILTEEYNLFSEKCFCWKGKVELYKAGTELILRKSQELGIPSTYGTDVNDERGFQMQGLALKFEHGAPDAVPAFFYWCDDSWTPLFNKSYDR